MQIEKRLEKLKKSKAKDSQSKVKVIHTNGSIQILGFVMRCLHYWAPYTI